MSCAYSSIRALHMLMMSRLYSREGPRPAMPVPVEETLIDLDESPSVDTATPQESINVDRSDGTTITVGKPDFGDESTTEEKTEMEDVSMS